MHKSGERPGKGSYKCNTCGEIVNLEKDTDTLRPCPKCRMTTFTKL